MSKNARAHPRPLKRKTGFRSLREPETERRPCRTGVKLDTTGYPSVPPHTLRGLREYIEEARVPGGFLTAVITNDLRGAVQSADWENKRALPAITEFLTMKFPVGSYGSLEAMHTWLSGTQTKHVLLAQHATLWREHLTDQYAHLHHPMCMSADLDECSCGLGSLVYLRELVAIWVYSKRRNYTGLNMGGDPFLAHIADVVMASVNHDLGALRPLDIGEEDDDG